MAELADRWTTMATDARHAAQRCLDEAHYRSAVSRAYYAVFSAVTAELLRRGARPRSGWGTWTHGALPVVAREQLRGPYGPKVARDVRQLASRCYKLREMADYVPALEVGKQEAMLCLRNAAAIIRIFGIG